MNLKKIKFVRNLDAFQIIKARFSINAYDETYYFDISNFGKVLLRTLRLIQWIKPLKFNLDEIRNKSGKSRFVKMIGEDLNDVFKDIELNLLGKSLFLDQFSCKFDKKVVVTYFKKRLWNEIKNVVVFMNVIAWYQEKSQEKVQSPVEFSIERILGIKVLKDFALSEYNIALSSYISLRGIINFAYHLLGNLYLCTISIIMPVINIVTHIGRSKNYQSKNSVPVLASNYSTNGVTFDLASRCDFFWLLNSMIPHKQVLIYFERKDVPANDAMVSILKKNRVNYIALSKGATTAKNMHVYKPSIALTKMLSRLTIRIFLLAFKETSCFRFGSLAYMASALYFVREFAKAYDFFHTMGIKVHVESNDFEAKNIPRWMALRALGGISVSYQRSDMPISTMYLGSTADIYFSFGPYYHSILQKNECKNKTVVTCGYITDYSFATVRERSGRLREKIKANGAEFIVCFFDENSSDDRFSLISNKKSSYVYKTLMNWILSDGTIGLICSPKRPATLSARLSTINDLMEKAESTGRCVFMGGDYMAANYPTEAAQASDIVIALLIGGTAFLESVLSGVRGVFLDLEGLHSFDEYKWGKDTVAFDNLDIMIAALDKYRRNPQIFDEIGNVNMMTTIKMMATIKQKDPFRDGRAGERMGTYLHWCLDAIGSGQHRNKAIENTNNKYASIWGSDKVIPMHFLKNQKNYSDYQNCF
jgi:hypothetical protein